MIRLNPRFKLMLTSTSQSKTQPKRSPSSRRLKSSLSPRSMMTARSSSGQSSRRSKKRSKRRRNKPQQSSRKEHTLNQSISTSPLQPCLMMHFKTSHVLRKRSRRWRRLSSATSRSATAKTSKTSNRLITAQRSSTGHFTSTTSASWSKPT